MNKNRLTFLAIFLVTTALIVRAQTNAPAAKPEPTVEIDSDSGYFDGITNQMVYIGHVFVTDHVKARLTCERLTVDLPASGGNPTNIVAETNVVVDLLLNGDTNHVTADKATYTYGLTTNPPSVTAQGMAATSGTIVTNEFIVFTGGTQEPMVDGPRGTIWSDPLVFDVVRRKFAFYNHVKMVSKQSIESGSNSNSSPFNLLK